MPSQVRQGNSSVLPKDNRIRAVIKSTSLAQRLKHNSSSLLGNRSLGRLQIQGWLASLCIGHVKQSLHGSPSSSPILLESQELRSLVLTRGLVLPLSILCMEE